MKTEAKSIFHALLLLLGLFLLAYGLPAQTNDLLTGTNAPPAGGVAAVATPALSATLLMILIPTLTPMIIAIGKRLLPAMPVWVLPILAPALGEACNELSKLAGQAALNPALALALGSAGVGIRELGDQVSRRITDGAAVKTASLLFLAGLLAFAVGCATQWIDKVSQTRLVTVHGAYRAVSEFNAWYQPRTNNPAAFNTTLPALQAKWNRVNAAAKEVGLAALVAEAAEDGYRQAPTNSSPVVSAVAALSLQTSNIVNLIQEIEKP